MAEIPLLYSHFNIGVIGNDVKGRIDAEFYRFSLDTCKNAVITPYGNLLKRAGTRYLASIVCSQARFIPFVYDRENAYGLLFITDHDNVSGDNRIYFFTENGYVLDGGGNPYYISSPYTDSMDLNKIQYAQKDDIMYLAHPDLAVQKLTRISHNNWTINTVSFDTKYLAAYGDGSKTEIEVYLPVGFPQANNVTLHFTISGTNYSVTDDGAGNFIHSQISNGTVDYDTGRVYVKFANPPDLNTPITIDYFSFSSPYPSAITFFENRLILANFGDFKQTFWGSTTGGYEDLTVGTEDNNAYIYTVASQENNEIKWIAGQASLLIGTQGAEFVATGGDNGITPTSINITRQTSYGSKHIQPLIVDNTTIFIQYLGRKVYSFKYDYVTNTYSGSDLNILNSDILDSDIVEALFQREPYSRAWFLKEDGTIAILTLISAQKIVAWHEWETNGTVLTMCAIPSNIYPFDRVFMTVQRGSKKYIEMIDYDKYEDYFDAGYSDCYYLFETTTPTDTINVSYLADGTEVSVLTDTGVHPNVTVSGGNITLQWEVEKAIIGIPYTYEVKLPHIEIVGDKGSTLGRHKAVRNLSFMLDKSVGGEFGYENDSTDLLYYRLLSYNMNELVPLFSGVKDVVFNRGMAKQVQLIVKHSDPTPFNLLAISFDLEVGNM